MSIQKEKERYLFILIVSDDDRQLCGQSRPVELPIVDLDGKEVNVAHIEIFSFINIAAYFNALTTSILGSPPNSTAEVPGLLLPLLPARGPGFFRTLLFFLQKNWDCLQKVHVFIFFSKFCAQGDLGPVWDGFGKRGAGVELDPPQLSCQRPGYFLKLKNLITLTVKTPVHRKPIFRPASQCSGSPCPTGVSAATTSTIR